MTPIEIAMAKAMGALIDVAKEKVQDIAIDTIKDVVMPESELEKQKESVVLGFENMVAQKDAQKKKEVAMQKKADDRRKKIREFDLEVARKQIDEEFKKMFTMAKKRPAMRMVANRIKKKNKKKKAKK